MHLVSRAALDIKFSESPAQLTDMQQQALQLPGSFHGDHHLSFSDQQVCIADSTGKPSVFHPQASLTSRYGLLTLQGSPVYSIRRLL